MTIFYLTQRIFTLLTFKIIQSRSLPQFISPNLHWLPYQWAKHISTFNRNRVSVRARIYPFKYYFSLNNFYFSFSKNNTAETTFSFSHPRDLFVAHSQQDDLSIMSVPQFSQLVHKTKLPLHNQTCCETPNRCC